MKLKNITLIGVDCVNIKRLTLAMDICQEKFEFAEVKILTSLPTNLKNVVKIKPINSAEAYSRFILAELNNYFNTSHVLIVQYDGFILNHSQWTDEFLEYDYIGAPWLVGDWAVKDFAFPKELLGQYVVGNGGFSLRSKKLTALSSDLYKAGKLAKFHPEDAAICVYYRQLFESQGVKFAPVELAKQFSYEAEDDNRYAWDGQFGFHGLEWTDISRWTKVHPQYKIANPAEKQ